MYLGCRQEDVTVPSSLIESKIEQFPKLLADTVSCTSTQESATGNGLQNKGPKPDKDIKGFLYEIHGHAKQIVEKYLELANKEVPSLKAVETPCIDDHLLPPEDFETKGSLSPIAARIVVKGIVLSSRK